MLRILLRCLSALGLISLAATLVLTGLVYTGVFTLDKLRLLVKYNPLATSVAPVTAETAIHTPLLRMKLKSYNLSAMGLDVISGGGAIQPIPGGMLVAERSGRFVFFDERTDPPTLRDTDIRIDINQAGFEAYATSQGYAIKPGRNIGYAGLGMRLHDLLLLRDGKRLAATYTRWDDAKKCVFFHLVIANFTAGDKLSTRPPNVSTPSVSPWRPLYDSTPCMPLSGVKRKPFAGHQAGGRMAEMADGRVLFTVGDFKNDGVKRKITTADRNNSYGKLHLIDPDSRAVEIYSTGHRNPQGLVIASDDRIWSTEHGPTGGDEVNLIVRGEDYGWPAATLGRDCAKCAWQQQGRHDGHTRPIFAYVPSIGISNVIELQGFAPLWDEDLLVASLKQETLHHLRIKDGRVIFDEPLRIGDRLRDIQMLKDGRVALWTDTGKLQFLSADKTPSPSEVLAAALSPAAQDTIEQCRACHDLDPGIAAPDRISLWGIFDRTRASLPGAAYSKALQAAGGTWTKSALESFLTNPAGSIPGTSMAYEGVQDAALREELTNFLKALH